MPASRHVAALRQRRVEDVQRQRADQAGVLGQRDELVRRQQPALRVLPAHQRLDAVDVAGREHGLRLVVDDELVLVERAPQLADERQAARVVLVLRLVVDLEQRVLGLGLVHGDVGALHERVDVVAVIRVDADADRRLDRERQALEVERLLDAPCGCARRPR